jgi:phage terminase large subunit
MAKLTIPYNFQPRQYQIPLFKAFDAGIKRGVCCWHRRAGKDKCGLNLFIREMFKRKGQYYHLFPTARQARKAIWDGIDKDGLKVMDHFPKEVIVSKNETDMKITLTNGSIYQLVGTDMGLDWLVGTNPVGLLFSEYPIMSPKAWDFLRPIIRENDGIALFVYTPRGQNHGHRMFEMAQNNDQWFCSKLTVEDTRRDSEGEDGSRVVSADDLEEERREGMDEQMIQQEYYCSFHAAIPGAYFAKEMTRMETDGRIGRVPWEPKLRTSTYWDLGIDDSMSVVFAQQHGQEIRIIDYYEASGEGLPHFISEVKSRPYSYDSHNAPWDIEVRELTTGKTRRETARSLGINFRAGKKVNKKEEAIEQARQLLSRCWMDRRKCERLIASLRNYHKEYDDKNQVFKARPVHNWASHGADSFMELAMSIRPERTEPLQMQATNVGEFI